MEFFKPTWTKMFTTILFTAGIVGIGGYLLTIRSQSLSPSLPIPPSQQLKDTQLSPTSISSIRISSPIPFPTLSSSILVTWKTFISKYGYSFQYPPDFNPSGHWASGRPGGQLTDIALYKPTHPKPTGYSYYGILLTVDIFYGSYSIAQEKPEAFPTLYPHEYKIDNTLLPASVILPPDTTTGGYWVGNSPAVDFFTHSLLGKFRNIPVALRFGCSDDTQKDQCAALLPQVLSTLRFSM